MVTKYERYTISSIANFFIGLFFILLYWRVSQIEPTYAIGLLIIAIAFLIKCVADYIYAKYPISEVRSKFHWYTFIHYALVGITLIIFPYFGYTYSYLFAALSLLFSYYEFKHVKELENEKYRFRRHLMATVFRWFVGSLIFFDSLFYNVVQPTLFGWFITVVGTVFGIYILYSAITTYRYITSTSKITLKEALFNIA